MDQAIEISSEMIRLGQLLEARRCRLERRGREGACRCRSGEVDGECELRRGRQVRPGDIVCVGSDELRIVAIWTVDAWEADSAVRVLHRG